MFNSVSQKDLLTKPCVVFLPSINIPPRETEISLENPDLSHQFTINSVSRSPDSKSGKCGLLLPVYTPPNHHLITWLLQTFSGLFQLREAAWVLWLVALPPSSKHITPTSPNLTSPLADFDPPGVILEPFQ